MRGKTGDFWHFPNLGRVDPIESAGILLRELPPAVRQFSRFRRPHIDWPNGAIWETYVRSYFAIVDHFPN